VSCEWHEPVAPTIDSQIVLAPGSTFQSARQIRYSIISTSTRKGTPIHCHSNPENPYPWFPTGSKRKSDVHSASSTKEIKFTWSFGALKLRRGRWWCGTYLSRSRGRQEVSSIATYRWQRRPLGYECNHQRNLKIICGAKSNELILKSAQHNAPCPSCALTRSRHKLPSTSRLQMSAFPSATRRRR
jgi:hypothetical protein